MKGRILLILIFAYLAVAAIVAMAGCAVILEGDKVLESIHYVQQTEIVPEERIEVSDYEELMTEMLDLVMQHENYGRMRAYSYDGDVEADVQRACREIENNNPIGAYAVSDITGAATRIVSYYEVEINIEYKRTKQQVDSIVNVSTLRYLGTELFRVMSDYSDEAIFRTTLSITEEEIDKLVKETYYKNPRKIVMMPTAEVEIFRTSGEDRIIELRLIYDVETSILQQYTASLAMHVGRNAESADGEEDEEILLSLTENLMGACRYEAVTARNISNHGTQDFAVTAFGALVRKSAVGEGYAMAFKALCDELDFDCWIVLGYRDGMIHAWNIVSLHGDFYHIDVAMCTVNGIETAFLKTDADFAVSKYAWDMVNTASCEGTLTYEDIVGVEDIDEIPDDENGEPEEGSSDNVEQSIEPMNNEAGQAAEPTEEEPEITPDEESEQTAE